MTATISGDGTSTLINLTTSGNTVLGDASTDTLNVGNGGLVKDASGNVGIGTASPTVKLQLKDGRAWFAPASENYAIKMSYNDATQGVWLGSPAANVMGFYDNNGTERARIDSSGNLLVGTTSFGGAGGLSFSPSATAPRTQYKGSSSSNTDTTFEIYSTGVSAFRFYVGYGGTVYATNTTISAISDIRYKENVRDLNVGLAEVLALKPRLYDWKEGKGANVKNARGFIAQEFETVFPDLIDEWKDPAPEGEVPYKSVRQDLIPVLVKAIQEQQAIITQLQADVAALKAQP